MIKKSIFFLGFFISCLTLTAQESTQAFTLMKLPMSVHATALGGENVSLIENAPSLGWHNPALLSNVDDKTAGLNFMTYASGTKLFGAQYAQAFGERHTAAAMVQYMSFGSMDETDVSGHVIGQFTPKDFTIGLGYSYLLSNRWSGGATLKFDYSRIANYSACALAVDLGLNYFDETKDFSLSLAMRNVGAPLKTYDSETERIPFNLQLGFTKGVAHLPVRIHVTASDLTHWKKNYYYTDNADGKVGVGALILNHFNVGLEVLPAKFMWIGIGYNFRRAYELKAAGSGHWAGITAGAGINVKGFSFGASYAKYHLSNASLMFNAAYGF